MTRMNDSCALMGGSRSAFPVIATADRLLAGVVPVCVALGLMLEAHRMERAGRRADGGPGYDAFKSEEQLGG